MTLSQMSALLVLPLSLAETASAGGGDVRRQIDRVAVAVEEAVRQTSRPSPLSLFGPAQMTRGYRIPGVGVVFVVPSRSVPSPRANPLPDQGQGASRLPGDAAPLAARSGAAQTVGQRPPGAVVTRTPPAGAPGLAQRAASITEEERVLRAMAEQSVMLHEMAAKTHDTAERAIEEMMRRAHPQTGPADAATVPPDGDDSNGRLLLPAMTPWAEFFLGEEAPETRTARQVLDDVRAALASALATSAPGFLGDDEWLVVTIDFFDDDMLDFVARPTMTLVARVRARDVAAQRNGTLSLDDFRKRIEYSELH